MFGWLVGGCGAAFFVEVAKDMGREEVRWVHDNVSCIFQIKSYNITRKWLSKRHVIKCSLVLDKAASPPTLHSHTTET